MQFLKLTFMLFFFSLLLENCGSAPPNQEAKKESTTYTNPIITADFSDPDVIRVGKDYYMTSSSFYVAPGLPVLHSKDLVNWSIIGHGTQHIPKARFTYSNRSDDELDYDIPRFGKGIYAPSIRFHEGFFYIYWGDPDAGVYMVKTEDPAGEWSQPVLVYEASGVIDPSPLWDESTNKAYLSFAYAKSRKGFNEIIDVCEINWEGTKVIGDPITVFNAGNSSAFPADRYHKTIEGTKFMKRNDWYYILCPAGGVEPGWQTAMRSKHPFGPYEIRTICETGPTKINGPHQGGLVESHTGEWWFIHFQSTGTLGRVVRLEPAYWENDWPVIGIDTNGDGIGFPISSYNFPHSAEPVILQSSDEFNSEKLGLQWQWSANYRENWYDIKNGKLILPAIFQTDAPLNTCPHVITQMFPNFSFAATTKMDVPNSKKIRGGLASYGRKTFDIGVEPVNKALHISVRYNNDALASVFTQESNTVWLRLNAKGEMPKPLKRRSSTTVNSDLIQNRNLQFFEYDDLERWENGLIQGQFAYSFDGKNFTDLGKPFEVRSGMWTGARIGLYSLKTSANAEGYVAFDYIKIDN